MVPLDAGLDVEKQSLPLVRGGALEEYLGGSLSVQLHAYDLVALNPPD